MTDNTFWGELKPPLDRDEQVALFNELNSNKTTATRRQQIRETLCLHNLRIVQQQVSKLTKSPEQAEDAFHSGVCGLLKAIDSCHTGEKAGMFYSYATVWVRGEIVKSLYTADGLKEKEGMRANQWRRWIRDNPNGTPQQAVDDGTFADIRLAEEAMINGATKPSIESLADDDGQQRNTFRSFLSAEYDAEQQMLAAGKLETLGLTQRELELLLTWAANGGPSRVSNETRNALEKAKNVAGQLFNGN